MKLQLIKWTIENIHKVTTPLSCVVTVGKSKILLFQKTKQVQPPKLFS